MQAIVSLTERAEVPLLVAFADLTGFAAQCAQVDDDLVAATLDGWYEAVTTRVIAAGGHVVKFVGDAALIVFDDADRGVTALLAMRDDGDRYFGARGWGCRVHVKAHHGPVIAGPYGGNGSKQFDVIGRTVNTAAMLDSTGIALSVEAFRALSKDLRQRFKKHTWPVTYIANEDPHRFRRR
jgi:adenylate cyclase